jgi:hypothetical protein
MDTMTEKMPHMCFYTKENCVRFCTEGATQLAEELVRTSKQKLENPTREAVDALYAAECAWRRFVKAAESEQLPGLSKMAKLKSD